jgi:hypothetical protein
MRYELVGVGRSAVVDDEGVHITISQAAVKENRFIQFPKLVAVSVRKPSLLSPGNIFFQTAADSSNPLSSFNTVFFKGKDNYELALEIKAAVENLM